MLLSAAWSSPALAACGGSLCDWQFKRGPIAAEICQTRSVDQNRYTITVAATAAGYTLTADPQAGPTVADGFMTLDDGGNRTWDKDDDNNIGAGEDNWTY